MFLKNRIIKTKKHNTEVRQDKVVETYKVGF